MEADDVITVVKAALPTIRSRQVHDPLASREEVLTKNKLKKK